jgi:hypothetical protein
LFRSVACFTRKFGFLLLLVPVCLACTSPRQQKGNGRKNSQFVITTTSPLPGGEAGTAYQVTFTAAGGVTPYDWWIASGSLPAGLALDSSAGFLAGTPSVSGSFSFVVSVQDFSGRTVQQSFSLSITPPPPSPLEIATVSLPQPYVPNPYAALVQVTGGTPSYTWKISAGQLPAGLSLSPATGEISGTPSAQGSSSFTVTAADSSSPQQTVSAAYSLTVAAWPSLDQYGGATNAPAPDGATGYFHLVKDGNRWLLADPLGNLFWMLSSYVVDTGDGGPMYSSAVLSKYGNTQTWAAQATARLLSWGFNTIGPQPGVGSHNVLPVSTDNAEPNPRPMPFLRYIDLSSWCVRNISYQVKNLYNGMNPAVFSVSRTFPDVFDPNWVACASYYAAQGDGSFTPNLPQNEPWMIGTWIGDADYLFGFGRGPQTPGGAHPHLGWIAATTSPTQASGPNGDFSNLFTYSDTTVYTKLAWQSYLEAKYGSIQALDAAWGSNYTTFGSAGGWPKKTTGGTGLLDEDGSGPWMGNGSAGLVGANANLAADLDAFLAQIAQQYFSVAAHACKTAYPNHLVFGPGSLNVETYPQVLQAAGQYLDVIEVWVEPQFVSTLADSYNTAGKPLVVWTSLQAQPDSYTTTGWGAISSTCNITAGASDYDYATQDLRGQCYRQLVDAYWNTQGADGSNPVVGLDWWEFVDKVVGGENTNFGLVGLYDNAYDGVEDQIAKSADPWGYPVGGQTANYGNFLGYVQQENVSIINRLSGIF